MTGYWTDRRPNGKPLDPGQVCWVTEVEGQNPVYTYGKDQQEVIDKLSRNNAHAQVALTRRATAPAATATATPPAVRPRLSADDVMRRTADLDNPATAGRAVRDLLEDATGLDIEQVTLRQFADTASAWEEAHPEFYPHPGNKRLLTDQAKAYVGGRLGAITAEILTQSYNELAARGLLMEAPAQPNPTPAPSSLPGESPVQRTERPRGAMFATGARSTGFRQPQTSQTRTPKYTAEEIRTMPDAKARQLNEANDPDYIASCEYHFGNARASA